MKAAVAWPPPPSPMAATEYRKARPAKQKSAPAAKVRSTSSPERIAPPS